MPMNLAVAALAMLALSMLAFWPAYLSKFGAAEGYTHFHAALGVAWLLLLVAQPVLVVRRRLPWHRGVGRVACGVGAAFVVSGVLVAHRAAKRMDAAPFAAEGFGLYLPLVMAAIFAAALALGVAWRRVPAVHARFMACTALPLVDPLLARLLSFHVPPLPSPFLYPVPAFVIVAGVLIVLARTLPRGQPGRRAFGAFAVGTVVALLLFFATPYSGVWLAFVQWFRAVPIT